MVSRQNEFASASASRVSTLPVTSADLSSGVEFRETDPKARRAPRTHHCRLIERGDVVLDPFCGCGATVHAAQKLKRQWIGIDVTRLAIALIERRLKEAFPGITYEVNGVPKAELNAPTREMGKEAASAGFYETSGRKFLKLQILTAAQVIDGKRPQVPFGHTESLKKASRESDAQQARLL
jgi:DNA methylase